MGNGKRIVLTGGGGHCKSVLDVALRMNAFEKIVITDNNMPIGSKIMGCEIVGNDEMLYQLLESGIRYAFITVGSIKNVNRRTTIYRRLSKMGFLFPNIIDPSAAISSCSHLGQGIFVGKNAVINAGTIVKDMAIINSGAIVEHDSIVGEFSHVAVGAAVCGGVIIDDFGFVGANATIIQGVKVGKHSVIGAGSVVLRDILPGENVYGVVQSTKR